MPYQFFSTPLEPLESDLFNLHPQLYFDDGSFAPTPRDDSFGNLNVSGQPQSSSYEDDTQLNYSDDFDDIYMDQEAMSTWMPRNPEEAAVVAAAFGLDIPPPDDEVGTTPFYNPLTQPCMPVESLFCSFLADPEGYDDYTLSEFFEDSAYDDYPLSEFFDDSASSGLLTGSLLDLHNVSTGEVETYSSSSQLEATPNLVETIPEPVSPRRQRRATRPTRTSRQRAPPSATQSPSSSPSTTSSSASRTRRGHRAGWNVLTNSLTLTGIYPPLIVYEGNEKAYYCKHPPCAPQISGNDNRFGTRNGYKYHLNHGCLQNPSSVANQGLARGVARTGGRARATFSETCQCGKTFRSRPGWNKHRFSNETTRNGRCLERRNRSTRSNR